MESPDLDGVITPRLRFAENSIDDNQVWLSSQAMSQRVDANTPAVIVKSPFGEMDPHHCGCETPGAVGSKLTSFRDSVTSK